MKLTLLVPKLPNVLEDYYRSNNGEHEEDGMYRVLLYVQHLVMSPPAWAGSRATALFLFYLWILRMASHVARFVVSTLPEKKMTRSIVACSRTPGERENCSNGDQSSHESEYTTEFAEMQTCVET